jgi:hypothetical protein
MRNISVIAVAAFLFACVVPSSDALATEGGRGGPGIGAHRIGFGVNYFKTIDDLDENFDKNGFSYLASYQYAPIRILKIEADLELIPDLADSSDPVLAPQVFVTVGGLFYAAAGIGIYYSDGDWGNAPFYMLRAGLDFPILPRLFLDINANYRFNDWDTIEWADVDTDTIRLGAALRFTL